MALNDREIIDFFIDDDCTFEYETIEIPTGTEKPFKMAIPIGKWEIIKNAFTPGGDPLYTCPKCHDINSNHINGIETTTVWNYCPVCGIRLKY